jgi:hypothetical protein
MDIDESMLDDLRLVDLHNIAKDLKIRGFRMLRKSDLIAAIISPPQKRKKPPKPPRQKRPAIPTSEYQEEAIAKERIRGVIKQPFKPIEHNDDLTIVLGGDEPHPIGRTEKDANSFVMLGGKDN